jgi:hypothetical protein
METDNTYYNQKLLCQCGFLIDHVSSKEDSAVKFNDDEEDIWKSLQLLGAQFKGYTTCDGVLEVQAVWSVD